jgi:hypothetical protein
MVITCPSYLKSVAVFCVYAVCMVLTVNSVNQLIFVMVKCGVLFEVRTGFLNNIKTSFGFKGLINDYFLQQR